MRGNNGSSNLNFTFSTDHRWGEAPDGNWTVRIIDTGTSATDQLLSYSLRIYGDDQGNDTTYFYTDDFANMSGDRGNLVDTSGIDTINAAAVTTNLLIDLTPGATSTIAGRPVVIGSDTVIENVYGGDGDDVIIGNDANNYLYGGHGHNTIYGGAGNDIAGRGTRTAAPWSAAPATIPISLSRLNDVIVENPNEGNGHRVYVYIDHYVLGANLENCYAELTTGQTITGNDSGDCLYGNIGNDTLLRRRRQRRPGRWRRQRHHGRRRRATIGISSTSVRATSSSSIPAKACDAAYAMVSGYTLADNVEVGVLIVSTPARQSSATTRAITP